MRTELICRKRIYTSFNDENDWKNINADLFNIPVFGVTPWEFTNSIATLSLISSSPTSSYLQRSGIEYGKKYRVSYTLAPLEDVFVGNFKVVVGGTNGITRTAAGIYSEEITAGISDNTIKFVGFRAGGGTDPILILKDVTIEEFEFTSLDLYEDVDVNLNYLISDIRDIANKNASYSKEINIPGTSKNTVFFNHVFNINSDTTFSTNRSCNVKILIDGIEVLNGNLQLKNVIEVKGSLEYIIVATDVVKDIFFDMGESYLDELDNSSLDHIANWTNVKMSFVSSFEDETVDYVYPYIDYGLGINSSATGRKMTDMAGIPVGLLPSDLFPAVRVKYIMDQIFAAYGYTYESALFDLLEFKYLIIPYSRPKSDLYDFTFIETRYCSSFNTAQVYGIYSNPDRYSIPVDSVVGANYHRVAPTMSTHNLGLNASTVPYGDGDYATFSGWYGYTNSLYSWRAFMKPLQFTATYPAGSDPVGEQMGALNVSQGRPPHTYRASAYGRYKFELRYSTTGVSSSNHFVMRCFKMKTGSITTATYGDLSGSGTHVPEFWFQDALAPELMGSETITSDVAVHTWVNSQTGESYVEIDMEPGDLVWFSYNQTSLNGDQAYNISMINPNPFNVAIVAEMDISYFGYMLQSTIHGSDIVPKMKQIDFLKNIFTMFNVYCERSKTIDRHYILKPFKDYYNGGANHDWTTKLDVGAGRDIKIATDLMSKTVNFKYKDVSNYLRNIYKNIKKDAADEYGDYHIIFDNEFVIDKIDIEISELGLIPIGPLFDNALVTAGVWPNIKDPNYQDFDINLYHKYYEEMIVGRVVDGDEKGPNVPTDGNVKTNVGPFIAFFSKAYFYDYLASDPNNPNLIRYKVNSTSFDYLPSAGHMLNPKTGQGNSALFDDLSFSQVDPYFYSEHHSAHTGKNIYNIFWKRYIDAINHKDSRLATMYFKLEAIDMFNLSLADHIYVIDTWYIINKIIDWNPINKITKVELLKIDMTTAFDAPIISLLTPNTAPTGSMPSNSIILGLNNSVVDNNNLVIGNGNSLLPGASYDTVNGNNNQIAPRAVNVNITGSDNVVGPDTSDITLNNSDNCSISANCSGINIDNSDYITIAPGVTNVTVSNTQGPLTITQSNISYINGNTIEEGSLEGVISANILEGGLDTVQNLFGVSPINLVNGGENVNRETDTDSAPNIISGGVI